MATSCRICEARSARLKLRKGGVEILECPACHAQFWEPPEDFQAERLYAGGYFDGADSGEGYDDYAALEPALRRTFRRRLDALGVAPAGEARLLDVGAAYGYGVLEARRQGWRAAGVEVSAEAARFANAHGAPIARATAAALPFPDGRFDALTLWDVLEHLVDPNTAVAEAARVLRPGGVLAFTTGDVGSLAARLSRSRWHLYNLPEHLFFFSRKSLGILLERHGFRVDRMRAEGGHYTVGYLVERLRKTVLGREAGRPARWPGAALTLPVNLLDVVRVCAVRRS